MKAPSFRVMGMVTVALLASISTFAASAIDPGPAVTHASQEIATIVALDPFLFDTQELAVVPGQQVTVVNEGSLHHDLVVDEWSVSTGLLGHDEHVTFTVPEDAEVGSTITFYCSVPGHRESGMEGTFTIVADEGAVAGPPTSDQSAIADQQPVTVTAIDIAYETEHLEVYPGQEITVINDGVLQHDLVVNEWDVATDMLNSGEQGSFVIPDDAEVGSTVTFHCSVPGHKEAGMEGTFTVVDPPALASGSEIDKLQATIAALEQQKLDLSATTTAIAVEQDAIDERIVSLQIQRDALIQATAAANGDPTPTFEPIIMPERSKQASRQEPTATQAS